LKILHKFLLIRNKIKKTALLNCNAVFTFNYILATHIKLDTLIFNMLTTQAKPVISSKAKNPLNPQTADLRVFSLRSK